MSLADLKKLLTPGLELWSVPCVLAERRPQDVRVYTPHSLRVDHRKIVSVHSWGVLVECVSQPEKRIRITWPKHGELLSLENGFRIECHDIPNEIGYGTDYYFTEVRR